MKEEITLTHAQIQEIYRAAYEAGTIDESRGFPGDYIAAYDAWKEQYIIDLKEERENQENMK